MYGVCDDHTGWANPLPLTQIHTLFTGEKGIPALTIKLSSLSSGNLVFVFQLQEIRVEEEVEASACFSLYRTMFEIGPI